MAPYQAYRYGDGIRKFWSHWHMSEPIALYSCILGAMGEEPPAAALDLCRCLPPPPHHPHPPRPTARLAPIPETPSKEPWPWLPRVRLAAGVMQRCGAASQRAHASRDCPNHLEPSLGCSSRSVRHHSWTCRVPCCPYPCPLDGMSVRCFALGRTQPSLLHLLHPPQRAQESPNALPQPPLSAAAAAAERNTHAPLLISPDSSFSFSPALPPHDAKSRLRCASPQHSTMAFA